MVGVEAASGLEHDIGEVAYQPPLARTRSGRAKIGETGSGQYSPTFSNFRVA